jgi:DNA-binding response OmpR family regulator
MNTPLAFPDHWRIFPSGAGASEPMPLPANPRQDRTRILIAEDDPVSREVLALRLDQWGYEVVVTRDGQTALAELRKPDAPALAILDWMMPELTGVEICRRIREADKSIYVILLSARSQKEDLVEGLQAGADDYLVKPFEKGELHARIQVGLRIIGLQRALAQKVAQLELAVRGSSSLPAGIGGAPLV